MKVLMFNHAFFYFSETFIYKQVTGMPAEIEIDLLGFDIDNEERFPLPNKKIRIRRFVNSADKIFSKLRRPFGNVRHQLSLLTSVAVKKLLVRNRYDLIHAHFGFNALSIFPIAKRLKIPLVVTFHGLDASPEMLKNEQYAKRIQQMIDYASAVIVVSPHMKEALQLEKRADKTYLIPCGVDPNEFDVHKRPENNQSITILHSGRLVSKKGVPDLLRVFTPLSHKYAGARLVVIGDGPELSLCKKLAVDARPGSVEFLGAVSHSEVKKFMGDTDIFVLNSRVGENGDMEGLPVSLLEAMSMQMAVVSTKHAGIPYVITDSVDGLLVGEKDNAALGSALEKLINDAELRRQLGTAARTTVSGKFSSAETNRKILQVYNNVASSR